MHNTIWGTSKFDGLAKTHYVYGGLKETVDSGEIDVVSPEINLSDVSAIIFDIYGLSAVATGTGNPEIRFHFTDISNSGNYIGITRSDSTGTRVISTVNSPNNISTSLAGNVWPILSTDAGFMCDLTISKIDGHLGYSVARSNASPTFVGVMKVLVASLNPGSLSFTSCVTTVIHKTTGPDIVKNM